MEWQEYFRKLERNKQWDDATGYMQEVLKKNPNDMDAYIAILYLLMNYIKYEYGGTHPWWYYSALGLELFNESYLMFSNNPEYLYYVGISMSIGSSFYIDTELNPDLPEQMLDKALRLAPDNLIYQWYPYRLATCKNPGNTESIGYMAMILEKKSWLQKELFSRGAIGEYLFGVMIEDAHKIVTKSPCSCYRSASNAPD